jgi:hypothetical protein
MKDKIQQTLFEYEALASIEPSDEWQQSLLLKLAAKKPQADTSFSTKTAIVIGLLFIGVNMGFIFTKMTEKEDLTNRDTVLQTISKELLINPLSMKN